MTTIEAIELQSYHSTLSEEHKIEITATFRLTSEGDSVDVTSRVVLNQAQMPSRNEQIKLAWCAFIPPALRVVPLLQTMKPVEAKDIKITNGSKPIWDM